MHFKFSFLLPTRSKWVALIAGLAVVCQVWAADPFVIRDIRVEGLQRVEPGTVFASIPVRVGDEYNE